MPGCADATLELMQIMFPHDQTVIFPDSVPLRA